MTLPSNLHFGYDIWYGPVLCSNTLHAVDEALGYQDSPLDVLRSLTFIPVGLEYSRWPQLTIS